MHVHIGAYSQMRINTHPLVNISTQFQSLSNINVALSHPSVSDTDGQGTLSVFDV